MNLFSIMCSVLQCSIICWFGYLTLILVTDHFLLEVHCFIQNLTPVSHNGPYGNYIRVKTLKTI